MSGSYEREMAQVISAGVELEPHGVVVLAVQLRFQGTTVQTAPWVLRNQACYEIIKAALEFFRVTRFDQMIDRPTYVYAIRPRGGFNGIITALEQIEPDGGARFEPGEILLKMMEEE